MKPLQHHKSGMSFIEVMLALTILGLMTSSALVLQSNAVNSIAHYANRISRIFLLESLIVKASLMAQQQQPMESPRTIEQPPTTLSYTVGKPPTGSALASLSNLQAVQITADWQQDGQPQTMSLYTYIYKPEKKKQ